MIWDLSVQALYQVVPLAVSLILFTLILGLAIIITWQLTKRFYVGYIKEQLDHTAKNIMTRHEQTLKEAEILREKLNAEKVSKKQAIVLLSKILERLST